MVVGTILKVFGIIFLSLGVVAAGTGYYLYNHQVFKTLTLCVGQDIQEDSGLACTTKTDCTNYYFEAQNHLSNLPEFIKPKLEEAINEAAVCEETCKIKETYGNFVGEESANFEGCNEGDYEINLEIRGKEGLALLKYTRERQNQ